VLSQIHASVFSTEFYLKKIITSKARVEANLICVRAAVVAVHTTITMVCTAVTSGIRKEKINYEKKINCGSYRIGGWIFVHRFGDGGNHHVYDISQNGQSR
jgi:hypothetical protein